jgi:flagellar assembly protein FliH
MPTLVIPFNAPPRAVSLAGAAVHVVPVSPAKDELQAAYERGLADGERKLSAQLLAQRNEFLALQRGVIESLRQAVPQVTRDAESALIGLAIEAAQKLVAGLPVDAAMVGAVVRDAVSQVEDTAEITVSVHPDDLAILERPADDRAIQFRAAPEISRGGCLVHTRFGVVDARRETKIELLHKAVSE